MKYKLIVSDFDGTLCRTDNKVSERSKKTIQEYIKRGGIFTLSSGRNIKSLRRRLPEAGLVKENIPLMGLQGSILEDNLSGKVLSVKTMPFEQALEFSRMCYERGLYHHVYTKDKIYSSKPNEYTALYIKLAGVGMEFVGDLSAFMKEKDRGYIKLLAVAEDGKNVGFAEEFSACLPESVSVFTSGPYFFEGISSSAGKGNGLKDTAALLGIDVSQTMAFGDEMNDLSMIEAAGFGVAVANAKPKLKEKAKLIAKSNDEDGVAEIIEKYCF